MFSTQITQIHLSICVICGKSSIRKTNETDKTYCFRKRRTARLADDGRHVVEKLQGTGTAWTAIYGSPFFTILWGILAYALWFT